MSARAQAVQAAKTYFKSKRDQDIFVRQMGAEAHFEDLKSPAGAEGYAQVMPSTAASWGLKNPHDPTEAYAVAAKHMAVYLRQYGGDWAKALTAYNAGPGAVGGKLPAETQNYIAKILGGKDVAAGPTAPSTRTVTSSKTIPGSTTQDLDGALVDQLMAHHHGAALKYGLLNALGSGAYDQTTPARTVTSSKTVKAPAPQGGAPKGLSPLYELYYDPLGGWKRVNGQTQSIGAIGGHSDHVHVAAGPETLKHIDTVAKQDGLVVTSTTGGQHAPNSWHYKGRAHDYAPPGGSPAAMRKFAHDVMRIFHVK